MSMHLKPFKVSKSENIYTEGDVSSEMYFIIKGEVGFYVKSNS